MRKVAKINILSKAHIIFVCTLIAGSVLSSACTQIRLFEIFGPGEFLILLGFIGAGLNFFLSSKLLYSYEFYLTSIIALTFGFLLILGFLWKQLFFPVALHSDLSLVYFLRGIAPLFVCALVVVSIMAITTVKTKEAILNLGILTVIYSTSLVNLFTLLALAIPNSIRAQLFYGPHRIRGLSENPNQFALIQTVIPFLAIFYAKNLSGFKKYMIYGCGTISLVMGFLTGSDGLILAWALAGLISLALLFANFIQIPLKIIISVATVGSLLFGIMTLTFFNEIRQFLPAAASDDGQGRIVLWWNGILALEQSPWVGFGPGAFSGFKGPFESFEAHNSFVDLGTQTGLLGLLLFCVIVLCSLYNLFRISVPLFASLLSILLFSALHFILRHPFFWVFLLFSALFSPTAAKR